MKLADYLAEFLANKDIDTIFGYQGSSISHTIDSISRNERLDFVETRHEQAAAFCANGYALAKNKPGVAIACSGPGALNLLTGIANAFYDSVPCLFITGQVSVHELKTNPKMRQFGFQETDIISIAKPITKYAVIIKDPARISYELEKAMYIMTEGRPGPVLIDIPHNVQGSNIQPGMLEHFKIPQVKDFKSKDLVRSVAKKVVNSVRPIIILGGGSRELRDTPILMGFLENLNVPIITSYRGKDVVDNNSSCYCGTLGVYGQRPANLAIKYCDLLIVLGSRLDGRQTGGDISGFADGAEVVLVDVDETELQGKPDSFVKIKAKVRHFLSELNEYGDQLKKDGVWLSVVKKWKNRYPVDLEYTLEEYVNPHRFLDNLSSHSDEGAVFAVDVGQNQIWSNASLCIGKGSTLLQSCGLGSMGFSLSAAMGGYYAKRTQTICISGDGGFQMNAQELQTIACNNIPIKIFVLNNRSLGLIRIYQSKALNGRFYGSVKGFDSPDYKRLAESYSIEYALIDSNDRDDILVEVLKAPGPYLVEVRISDNSTCCPEPTYQSTIENQSPILTDDEKEVIRKEAHELYGRK